MPPGHAYGKEINPLISHKLKKPNKKENEIIGHLKNI